MTENAGKHDATSIDPMYALGFAVAFTTCILFDQSSAVVNNLNSFEDARKCRFSVHRST